MDEFKVEIGGRTLSIETGRVAKQAHGACWVRYGDTVSMTAVCADDTPREYRGFFPLSVDYREKSYAAGKIPGGFFKREGRPSEKEIVSARLIDRPLRPLFPKDYVDEVQVMVVTLSSDQENDADILGLIGASASLQISHIPFTELVAAVRVGRLNGELVVNPTFSQLDESDLDLVVAGTPNHVLMVEGGCNEISEQEMLDALAFGHENIKKICELIRQVRDKIGKPKTEVGPPLIPEGLREKVQQLAAERIIAANNIVDKTERGDAIKQVCQDTQEALEEEFPDAAVYVREMLDEIEAADVRKRIIETSRRIDGRGLDDIREITCEVSVLPRTHGSALFTRGQTQALAVTTLGTKIDEQRIDALEGDSTKNYMLHYNFPPYSVGEVRPARGPGRREIGHGALAERSLEPILPADDDFPYTIRIVSDILESNGSSSMATVCGGSLALMDAGVPIKAPVAGIAMGLILEKDKHLILTDIMGAEDHFGDMDFKVAGTANGITAFQLDIKVGGLTLEIMREAL
ncbi:MAG: polyribonucleotide nucleotidyltransferase, partial [candidate division Zixibacteria bacterium]|nr:polyribonucleotide nucleotidyltransferase [candidate division Zixibacteria bacterium]